MKMLRCSVLMSLALLVFGDSPCLAAEPQFQKVDVFPAGMHGVTLYRIPGIVVTPKGTVFGLLRGSTR